mmetsp:Transcript_27553/g.84501  ORF Transcript_27553/g.84501 Transcript_27553/m.84501 type:complete len:322 (+) Transcript_27553:1446-2411(+)
MTLLLFFWSLVLLPTAHGFSTWCCHQHRGRFLRGLADDEDALLAEELRLRAAVTRSRGAWAGWEVKFDPRTGKVRPVEDLPEELREWGEPPLGLEQFSLDEERKGVWKRTTFRVEPEAGCAADEVAVSVASWGVDLQTASVRLLGPLILLDTKRFPSGECGLVETAPPFVEARTYFYQDDRRVRVDLKLDPLTATLLTCCVTSERRIEEFPKPPASKGSSRLRDFSASAVAALCGPCFATTSQSAAVAYGQGDGSTELALLDGSLNVKIAPSSRRRRRRQEKGCVLDVSTTLLSDDGDGVRRCFDDLGRLTSFGALPALSS